MRPSGGHPLRFGVAVAVVWIYLLGPLVGAIAAGGAVIAWAELHSPASSITTPRSTVTCVASFRTTRSQPLLRNLWGGCGEPTWPKPSESLRCRWAELRIAARGQWEVHDVRTPALYTGEMPRRLVHPRLVLSRLRRHRGAPVFRAGASLSIRHTRARLVVRPRARALLQRDWTRHWRPPIAHRGGGRLGSNSVAKGSRVLAGHKPPGPS